MSELDARLAASFAGSIEEVGGAFPDIRLKAQRFIKPGTDQVRMTHNVSRFESLWPFFLDDLVVNVGGRRGEAAAIEGSTNYFWRMIEIAGEFHFAITDGGDPRERGVKLFFEIVAHGVELQPDTLDPMKRLRGARGQSGSECSGGRGFEKGPTIHWA